MLRSQYSAGMKPLETSDTIPGRCGLCGTLLPVYPEETVQGRAYHHCSKCDLLQMAEADRLDTGQERARYLKHDNSLRSQGYVSFLERLILPVLAELDRQGLGRERGLDFGSGPYPMLASLMAERGIQLELYDPLFAPRDRTELLSKSFDYIFCCEVAEHFYRPKEEFGFMTELLAPGGFIAIMTSLRRADARIARWHYAQDETHVALYSGKTMEWIAGRFNLQLGFPAPGIVFLHKTGFGQCKSGNACLPSLPNDSMGV